jgi:hypothetical protein
MTTLPETPVKSPVASDEKRAPSKFDAFHPAMPQIPGVQRPSQASGGVEAQRLKQIGGIAGAALVVGLAVLWWVKSVPRAAVGSSIPADATVDSAVPAPPFPVSAPGAHEGPTVAATVEELSKPWASKKFTFVNPVTSESVDAIVIKLPSGALWAFSLQEPYGQCQLEFVTDLARLSSQFGFRASHPMVVCPCNNTISDPLKVGALGGDVWARGEIVQGAGLRPPIGIDTKVSGHSIIADNIE